MDISHTTYIRHCDVGDHDIVGEAYEARTANWLVHGDMVCVMVACSAHADEVGAHTRAWWNQWLRAEGAGLGYTSLS